jgi:vesicle coat complex subunit
LTAIAEYKVSDGKEAESICDRVVPRLQHANGAVVLAAVKVYKKARKNFWVPYSWDIRS